MGRLVPLIPCTPASSWEGNIKRKPSTFCCLNPQPSLSPAHDLRPSLFCFVILVCVLGGGVLHHTTCGISVPWLEIKPGPLAMRARRLNRWTTRESPPLVFYVQEQPPWLGPELRNDENLCALFVWNKAWQLTVGMGFPQELWLRFGDPPLGRSNTKQGHQQGPPFNTPCRCVWPGTLSFSLAIAWPSVA